MSVVTDTTNHENGSRGDWTGLFSEESLMSVATDTTKHEKDDGLSIAARLAAGAGNWIPAFAGMTIAVSFGLFSG